MFVLGQADFVGAKRHEPTKTIPIRDTIGSLVAIAEGQSAENLLHQAIKDYLFTRQFRTLRAYLVEKSQGSYTDEDIFEIVS